ncbi:hypothetical protein A2531_01815 [Candidatus Falkowbacteria bacterium RIFOXYD2_FULL_34_120]|uniref:Uncharacterized protein n=1 Tax=Candidatus Falkowbacteria bacterium RIFOXYD2_FULL_34_120 TaxID=1798007 RepID=A0A1F5TLY5_9BACT|nr:MAG: hypothetical protein A2500_05895 [Candidatus Falkowbacteria bacterium RIFOXYC12_FULL_34_55]OGF38709.1 MAG: hypothetical protein A2515_01560 [Candidatus Falkowbacteria bacterium RIFOXYD12_FULL_34_57]OGF39943.1 MAG: hypothetical protein A2531_01815 [Candidatus Falkowbacteria bacterium RIFOXYD2_FULL_34_120]
MFYIQRSFGFELFNVFWYNLFINCKNIEFSTSQKEIKRRKKAFISLCIFFGVGLLFTLLFFNYQISFGIVYMLFGVLLLTGILTFRFLSNFAKNILFIDNNKIILTNSKNSSAINLCEVYKIRIKRRTNGAIREIYIWSKNGKPFFISAFENDFDRIEKIIIDGIDKDVLIKEVVEPLNFDHFLFYPIFGLCTGVLSALFFNTIFNANIQIINIALIIACIYAFVLGIFFILKKPMFSRSAKKNAIADYIFGAILIFFSIVIFLIGM